MLDTLHPQAGDVPGAMARCPLPLMTSALSPGPRWGFLVLLRLLPVHVLERLWSLSPSSQENKVNRNVCEQPMGASQACLSKGISAEDVGVSRKPGCCQASRANEKPRPGVARSPLRCPGFRAHLSHLVGGWGQPKPLHPRRGWMGRHRCPPWGPAAGATECAIPGALGK